MNKRMIVLSFVLSSSVTFAAQEDAQPELPHEQQEEQMGPIELAHRDLLFVRLRTSVENNPDLSFEEAIDRILPQFIAEEQNTEQVHAQCIADLDEQAREALKQQGLALLEEVNRLDPEQKEARLDAMTYDEGIAMIHARDEYTAMRAQAPPARSGLFFSKTKAAVGISIFAIGLYLLNHYRNSFRKGTV